jgi:HSP20 family protein
MTLIRWEPVRYRSQDLGKAFGTFFDSQTGTARPAARWVPAIDLHEEGERYVLRADLPGLSEQDVKIEVEDQVLTVSGERHTQHEESREGYHRVERASGSFSRSVRLPRGVEAASIEASFDKGVLEVSIPKPAESKPTRVQIKAGSAQSAEQPQGAEQPAAA